METELKWVWDEGGEENGESNLLCLQIACFIQLFASFPFVPIFISDSLFYLYSLILAYNDPTLKILFSAFFFCFNFFSTRLLLRFTNDAAAVAALGLLSCSFFNFFFSVDSSRLSRKSRGKYLIYLGDICSAIRTKKFLWSLLAKFKVFSCCCLELAGACCVVLHNLQLSLQLCFFFLSFFYS